MSTSSQFLGSGRKPVQRGIASAGTVTITAVDPNKTKLTNLGGSAAGGSDQLVLTNATTITVAATAGNVSWELEEWY